MTPARRFAICPAMACLLAACAGGQPDGFRDADRPLGASTRFDTAAFSGDWLVVARFGALPEGGLRFETTPLGVEISGAAMPELNGLYREGAAGVLSPLSAGQEPLVVMWVDADFETAAIGTASGSFGAVIDRDGVLPADRAAAARDILNFYGWDTTALQRTSA